jgi:transposase
MNLNTSELSADVDKLRAVIASLTEKNQYLEEYVRLLKKELFGRKTEKLPKEDVRQMRLFDEAEAIVEEEASAETLVVEKHARRKPGRKPLPRELPRVEVLHDLAESEKICACGAPLSRIGEEVCEKLDIIPASIRVIRHVRPRYACKNCEGVEDNSRAVKIAPPPVQIIPKSIVSPGLLAHIITSKFEDALPFYRQAKIFSRLGVDISRANMANWAVQSSDQCCPLLTLMQEEIRGGPAVSIDETGVQVMKEPGRANTARSYMWVYRGGTPEHPVIVYQYSPSRSGDVPKSYLKGFRGWIQTDGYAGYEALAREPGIDHAGCWAHVRRKFHDVIKASAGEGRKGRAREALDTIGRLYEIERQGGLMSPDERCELRKEKSVPILNEFKAWLEELSVKTPPKGLLGKAVNYALNQWRSLFAYTRNGHVRIDNNLAENAIRPFVVGRKNWLFSGHPRGAAASASLYSLIETAKANGLNPYFYLRYLFEQLPFAQSKEDYKRLMPQCVDRTLLPTTSSLQVGFI